MLAHGGVAGAAVREHPADAVEVACWPMAVWQVQLCGL